MSYPITASGHTSAILLLNMRRFVPAEDRERFENLRGTDELHQAINRWEALARAQSTFIPMREERREMGQDGMTAEDIGFATGVFRSLAQERFFNPTYHFNKPQIESVFPESLRSNLQFKKLFLRAWKRWDVYIRPTMTGFFVLRLTWSYDDKPRSLVNIAREAHRLQMPFDIPSARRWMEKMRTKYANDPQTLKKVEESILALLEWLGTDLTGANDDQALYYPVQWRLAMEVINNFIRCFSPIIAHSQGEIRLQEVKPSLSIPLHDLYFIYHLERVQVIPSLVGRDSSSPRAKFYATVEHIYKYEGLRTQLVSLLEGSLVRPGQDDKASTESPPQGDAEEKAGKEYLFPRPRDALAQKLLEENLASWNDEICILMPRTGLIIPSARYREYEMEVSTLPAPTLKVNYHRYWEAIERMIEFTFEARVLAQLVESETYRLLMEMSKTLEQTREDMYRGNVSISEKLKNQSTRAAHLMRLSALAQSMTHPFLWSRAEYAARKAEHLLNQLDIPRIFEHIQHNIEGITSLAAHVDEIYIADLTEKSNKRMALLSVVLSAVSLSLTCLLLPSFLQDWAQYCKERGCGLFYVYRGIGIAIAVASIVCSIYLLLKALRSWKKIKETVDELL